MLAGASGDFSAEQQFHEEHLAIRYLLGNKREIASALINFAYAVRNVGNYARARALAIESRELAEAAGDQALTAYVLTFGGSILVEAGDHVLGRAYLERSEAISRELEEQANPKVYVSLAQADRAQGDLTSARLHLQEALTIYREARWHRWVPDTLIGLAGLEVAEGQAERAARLLGAADALREALGVHFSVSERREYERERAIVAAALGEEAFAVAWAEGRSLSIEEAIAVALDETHEG
jgi:hypothetical protein